MDVLSTLAVTSTVTPTTPIIQKYLLDKLGLKSEEKKLDTDISKLVEKILKKPLEKPLEKPLDPPQKIPSKSTEPQAHEPKFNIQIDKSNKVNIPDDVDDIHDINAAADSALETIAAMAAADAKDAAYAKAADAKATAEATVADATEATVAAAAAEAKVAATTPAATEAMDAATEAMAIRKRGRNTSTPAETETDIESKLIKLKQLSVEFSTEEAKELNSIIEDVVPVIEAIATTTAATTPATTPATVDDNVRRLANLLVTTLDKLGPDPSRPVFEYTHEIQERIRNLVLSSIPKSERGTPFQTPLTPEQLKELASYIILKYKAGQVNTPTDVPGDPPYNGILFYTPPVQQSQLQICFLPGETLESKELQAVRCTFDGDKIQRLVITQRAFVSANPGISSMIAQCNLEFATSPYRRRLNAVEVFGDTQMGDDLTARINITAGLCAFAHNSPTRPLGSRSIPSFNPVLNFNEPPPPPPPNDPDDDPYTVLYDFTNKVGPRVSIPYIPANYPPNPFPDPDWSAPFPSVMIGQKRLLYSIGPILFDNKLFGRPLIMIRLHNYKTDKHPDGIYFWVYPSFSENGLARVYFTIDGGMILKGIDYTITTFVLEFLQVEINKYYVKHYISKLPNNFFPTKLTTRLQILDFFGEMIHLQDQWVYDFLCGLGIIQSPYVRDHAPIPPDFNRHCYVFYSNPLQDIAAPGCPPFYPDNESNLHLVALLPGAPHYTPTKIKMLQQCVSHGITLSEIRQDRLKTKREEEIFTSFISMNAKYRGESNSCTFPLRLCLSTTMDKIILPSPDGVARPQHFSSDHIFSHWLFTQWVQGCRDLGRCSISPVIIVIAGVTTKLPDLLYNQYFDSVDYPKILTKQYSASRLVTVSETHTDGQKYKFRRYLRSGADFNPDVDLITLDPDIYPPGGPPGGFASIDNFQKIEKFNLLPSAIKTSVELMVDLFCNPDPVYDKVRVSFRKLLRIPRHTPDQPPSILEHLIETARTSAAAAVFITAAAKATTAAATTAAAATAATAAATAATTAAADATTTAVAAATAAKAAADAAAAREDLLNALKIHILTTSVSDVDRQVMQPDLLKLHLVSPLDVIKQIMEVTGVYRYSIASSIFDSFLGIPGFQLTAPEGGFPANEEVKFYYLDKLGQYRSIDPPLGGNPRDFLSCLRNAVDINDFDPYIIDSVRDSEFIHPSYLLQLLGNDIRMSNLHVIINDVRQKGFINTSKVFSKMFLLRLLFNKDGKKIQVIVSVSSTITISGNNRKYVPFATDLQFTPTFIGPVDGDGGGVGETLETIIATAVRYISAGCSVATKPADYSQLSGYAQILKYLEIYFRQFGSVCFTYNSSQIGPFNCLHDPMLKFLTCVFSNQDAINAITAKWDWIPYLRGQGYTLSNPSAVADQTLEQNIQHTLRENRLRMLKVCEILIDPMLKILDTGHDHDVVNPDVVNPDDDDSDMDSTGSSAASSASSSAARSAASSEDSPPTWARMDGPSLSSQDSSRTFVFLPSHSPSSSVSVPGESSMGSSASPTLNSYNTSMDKDAHPGSQFRFPAKSVEPTTTPPTEPMEDGGGSLTNKKYTKRNSIKKHAHKSQNRSKSNNRKTTTTRKNLKFKRMIKKHTTKYKTYKRKAKGRKLRGNKYKNNKTMRRYRCVRK